MRSCQTNRPGSTGLAAAAGAGALAIANAAARTSAALIDVVVISLRIMMVNTPILHPLNG